MTFFVIYDILDSEQTICDKLHKGDETVVKSTGIVRKVDELGRIVLPKELRSTLDIKEKDSLEIYVDSDQIILKKYAPACIFCNNASDIVVYEGKNICKECLDKMKSL